MALKVEIGFAVKILIIALLMQNVSCGGKKKIKLSVPVKVHVIHHHHQVKSAPAPQKWTPPKQSQQQWAPSQISQAQWPQQQSQSAGWPQKQSSGWQSQRQQVKEVPVPIYIPIKVPVQPKIIIVKEQQQQQEEQQHDVPETIPQEYDDFDGGYKY